MTDLRLKIEKIRPSQRTVTLKPARYPKTFRNIRRVLINTISNQKDEKMQDLSPHEQCSEKGGHLQKSRNPRVVRLKCNNDISNSRVAENVEPKRFISLTYPEQAFNQSRKTSNDNSSSRKFISLDETENSDNNDPGWDKLRKLSDLEDFRRYANSVFGNQNVNPNVCISYHGFKRLHVQILHRREKRFKAPLSKEIASDGDGKGVKRKNLCPQSIPAIKRCKIGMIDFETYVKKLCQALADHKILKVKNWLESHFWYGSHWKSKSGLVPGKELAERNWRYTLRHFIQSMEETESVYRSMCCDQQRIIDRGSKLTISYTELEKVIDFEKCFGQFVRFYGPNEEISCKWCKYLEGIDVWHPY